MNRFSLPQALTWLVVCSCVILAGMSVRLAPVEMTLSWPLPGPWPGGPGFMFPAALALAVAGLVMLVVLAGAARGTPAARPWGELLLFFPALFALIWLLLPAGLPDTRSLVIGGLLALGAAWLLWRGPRLIAPPWRPGRGTWLVDGLFVLVPLAVGLALGQNIVRDAVGLSLLLYPLYALVQLALFLRIPVRRLRALGLKAPATSLLSAMLFALVHWPNPVVMLVTLAGMYVWSWQYQRGRPLWQLAVVMGLTATTFSQALPDDLTRHMRVGPSYVRAEAVSHLASGGDSAQPPAHQDYLARIYPLIIGREITEGEGARFDSLLTDARRHSWAFAFLSSDEYRRMCLREGRPLPPPAEDHWTTWPSEWRERIEILGGQDYLAEQGGTLQGYVAGLYRDVLGREASPREIAAWKPGLTRNQRGRLVEILLDHRLEKGQDGFPGLTPAQLQWRM